MFFTFVKGYRSISACMSLIRLVQCAFTRFSYLL